MVIKACILALTVDEMQSKAKLAWLSSPRHTMYDIK